MPLSHTHRHSRERHVLPPCVLAQPQGNLPCLACDRHAESTQEGPLSPFVDIDNLYTFQLSGTLHTCPAPCCSGMVVARSYLGVSDLAFLMMRASNS